MMLRTQTTPKCTGSIPTAVTTGITIGKRCIVGERTIIDRKFDPECIRVVGMAERVEDIVRRLKGSVAAMADADAAAGLPPWHAADHKGVHGRVVVVGNRGRIEIDPRDTMSRDADVRAAGVSSQKLGYLRDLSRHVVDGSLPLDRVEALSDDEIVDALVAVKGVGRWTAQMFLMFRLGRPDVLPELDLGRVEDGNLLRGVNGYFRGNELENVHPIQGPAVPMSDEFDHEQRGEGKNRVIGQRRTQPHRAIIVKCGLLHGRCLCADRHRSRPPPAGLAPTGDGGYYAAVVPFFAE